TSSGSSQAKRQPRWSRCSPAATSIPPCWQTSSGTSPTIGSAMRTAFAYTCARIIMFGASVMVLFWAGARGVLLLGLALLISALLSYILLNKQRQIIAAKLNGRLSRVGAKARDLSQRLDEGSRAEDEDEVEDQGSVDPEQVVAPDAEEPVRG